MYSIPKDYLNELTPTAFNAQTYVDIGNVCYPLAVRTICVKFSVPKIFIFDLLSHLPLLSATANFGQQIILFHDTSTVLRFLWMFWLLSQTHPTIAISTQHRLHQPSGRLQKIPQQFNPHLQHSVFISANVSAGFLPRCLEIDFSCLWRTRQSKSFTTLFSAIPISLLSLSSFFLPPAAARQS